MIVVTDGSQDGAAHGWAVLLIDAAGIVAFAYSGALLNGGSTWIAEWCVKGLDLWLVHHLCVAPTSVYGFRSDNLGASFGSARGSPSHCIWVDAICRVYASFLVFEFCVPAQHDTHHQDVVAQWQAKAERLAKKGAPTGSSICGPPSHPPV